MQIKDTNKSRRVGVALMVVCLLLQVMVSPNIGMGNGRINFAIVYAGVCALEVGGRSAVLSGFFAGLVFDLLSTGPVGLMSGLLTIFSFVLGREERNRFSDGPVSAFSAFGIGSLAVISAYHLCALFFGDAATIGDVILLRILPTFAMTFIGFAPFAYFKMRGVALGRGKHAGKAASLRESHYDTRNL